METQPSLNFLETISYSHEQWVESIKCLDIKKQMGEIGIIKNIKRDIEALESKK
ncbi:hypothetical protein KVL94_05070 [Helicobacter pylori]|nr:hypothetical protein KVL94_05070 [Helicobacter pylori]